MFTGGIDMMPLRWNIEKYQVVNSSVPLRKRLEIE